jgi:hypothetical protein
MTDGSDWADFCDVLDLGGLVPDSYRKYRPAVVDGLSFFLANLSEERTSAILAEQLALPADADVEQRLVAMARHCPVLHKLGQVLARDRRLPEGFRALLQTLETMPSDLGVEEGRALVEAELGPLSARGIVIDEPPLAEASVAVVIPFVWHENAAEAPRHGVFKLLKAGIAAKLKGIWICCSGSVRCSTSVAKPIICRASTTRRRSSKSAISSPGRCGWIRSRHISRRPCQRRLNFPEKCRAKNPWFSSVGDQPAY